MRCLTSRTPSITCRTNRPRHAMRTSGLVRAFRCLAICGLLRAPSLASPAWAGSWLSRDSEHGRRQNPGLLRRNRRRRASSASIKLKLCMLNHVDRTGGFQFPTKDKFTPFSVKASPQATSAASSGASVRHRTSPGTAQHVQARQSRRR